MYDILKITTCNNYRSLQTYRKGVVWRFDQAEVSQIPECTEPDHIYPGQPEWRRDHSCQLHPGDW